MSELRDDAIQRGVEQAIGFEPVVNAFDVNVYVRDGVVRLEGIVRNLEAKRAAERVASTIPGVRRVDNTLTVADARGLSDADMESAVVDALVADPAVDVYDVGATVQDGSAYLVGHADSAAGEEAAIEAASRAPGVKAVFTEIDISPGIKVDWVDLVNLVIDALDEADDIQPYAIDVAAETDGRIVLTGTVQREHDRERAAEVACSVDGVKEVVNRLQVE